MSNKSLQVCHHCGWSKVTTYHGLRTHQGLKGCTPKGMAIPEHLQFATLPRKTYLEPPIKIEEPVISSPNYKYDTVDIGLTFYQNFMEYASRVSSPWEVKDFLSDNHAQPPLQNYWPNIAVKQKNALRSTYLIPQNNTPAVMQLKEEWVDISQKATNLDETPGFHHFNTTFLTPNVTTQTTLPSPEPRVEERHEPFFQTPPTLQPTASTSGKSRRALDFSSGEQKAKQERMKADLQREIQVRQDRMVEVKSSAGACQDSLNAEWQQIDNVFSSVMKLVKDACQKALQPLEERRREVEREAESIVQNLQREIATLEQDIVELSKNSEFQPQVSARTSLETDVDASLSFGTLRAATSAMMSEIQQELEKLTSVELKRIQKFAVDVKLDPTTAHRSLLLSPDGKKVRGGGNNSEVPNTAGRFDMFGSVLGLNSLVSGRAYWEVEVANKSGWDLGVTRLGANRTGKLVLNPDNGYWVAVHYEDKRYAAMTAPPVRICPKEKPKKVGVFVDYEEGLVSFYDVTTRAHIYSFAECSFADEIRPYFSPHLRSETNENPLVICAV